MFDVHDTEDCPTQASSEADTPASLLNHSSTAYQQHSHHGGTRGAVREYCDNCESNLSNILLFYFTLLIFSLSLSVFGHATDECPEEVTY